MVHLAHGVASVLSPVLGVLVFSETLLEEVGLSMDGEVTMPPSPVPMPAPPVAVPPLVWPSQAWSALLLSPSAVVSPEPCLSSPCIALD